MFRRRRPRARRAKLSPNRVRRQRRLTLEPLEDRRLLAILTVNSTLDGAPALDGNLTLREAIIAANTNAASGDAPAGDAGLDEIRFAIPGAGPHTISISGATGALPDITEPLTIDGYSQAGSAPNSAAITSSIDANIQIIIDGNGGAFDGFRIAAGGAGSTIRGLVINDFGGDGIEINAANNLIIGNFIGTDVTGEIDEGNSGSGVVISGGTNNRIGGTAAADRNLISGNNSDGVRLVSNSTSGNFVLGNFIGTDKDGIQDLGNSDAGVELDDASGNTIGGATTASRNVIAANNGDGVSLISDSDSNFVQGNFIGLGRDGSTDLGNSDDGIFLAGGSSGNTIGGTTSGARNVIAANSDDGIDIRSDDTDGNIVQGNFIGTASNGTTDRGNTGDGVEITSGAENNLIGGAANGAANTIAFNNDGVTVEDNSTVGNRIERNSIFSNDNLGIDLDDDGVTPNDAGDGDPGPNLLQNFPVFIGNATLLGDSIALRYRVDSADGANATYPLTIEFFIADAGNQEGRTFLAADTYVAANAQAEKMVTIPAPAVLTNAVLVATATDAAGNTSEFSAPVEFSPPTILGSEPTVILRDRIIGQNQVDFYQYIAHSTGKLAVRIDFLHFFGNLDLEVRDQFGNLIGASNSSSIDQNFEQVIIPVVTQETYFISVIAVDFGDKQTNSYSLEVENFPAPVPAPPDLATASDTGMMNDDNVTADNTPTFRIQADLTDFRSMGIALLGQSTIDPNGDGDASDSTDDGAGVVVKLVNLDSGDEFLGFANRVGLSTTLWSFTVAAPLADGEYFVSAAVQVVDGADPRATGRGQLSDPLTIVISTTPPSVADISIDMLTASDTGMRDDDNVTNKMQPAFQGIAPAGSKVRLFANGELVGQTVAGSDTSDVDHAVGGIGGKPDDGLGLWEITVEPLADNGYDITLEIEDAAGNVTVFDPRFNDREQPIDIVVDTLEPNTPYLDLLDDTGRHDNDNITKDNTPQVTMTSTDPNIAFSTLLFTDNLKFRIYDRYELTAEFLLYDSAQDAIVDASNTPGDMFTSLTQVFAFLPEQFFTLFGGAANNAVIDIAGIGRLADGVHNLKLEVEDRAGNISHDFRLEITVDTLTPPVWFGLPEDASEEDGLAASSDTGVTTMPMTYADRVTSDTTPTLWGRAEANTIVRVFLDRNGDEIIDLLTDTFLGQTVAVPFDGNDAFPDGYWELTVALDLNEIVGLPKDGLRQLLVTAQDVAGNPMPMDDMIAEDANEQGVDELQIFLDTQGPQVTDVTINNLTQAQYDLFDPKPSQTGPTPPVHSLKISLRDLPPRLNQADQNDTEDDFLYEALKADIAASPGNYVLVGDFVGIIPIQSIDVMNLPLTVALSAVTSATQFQAASLIGADIQAGDFLLFTSGDNDDVARQITTFNSATGEFTFAVAFPNVPAVGDTIRVADTEQEARTAATAMVRLNFFEPLPDDRYTLTVRDNLVDPAGNKLDGESNAPQPLENPTFPSGDGAPGGDFVARFTIDSRPEIGVWAAGIIHIDTNGNFHFDPENLDFTNRDLIYTLGFSSDYIFAGNFVLGAGDVADGFDKLAAYGRVGNTWRFLIDFDNDGVPDDVFASAPVNGVPVAGNFDGDATNGDEVGVFTGTEWFFDTNHSFAIDAGDTVLPAIGFTDYIGYPVVGDFDGDGDDDVATYIASQAGGNFFVIDLNDAGAGADIAVDGIADHTFRVGTIPGLGFFGFPGVRERPVAADMNADGADDLGLWVPDGTAILPGDQGEWFFLLSDVDPNDTEADATVIDRINAGAGFVPFSITPFGDDLYARFGNSFALPIVGNFDPPATSGGGADKPAPAAASASSTVASATATATTPAAMAAATASAVPAIAAASPTVTNTNTTPAAVTATATVASVTSPAKIAAPATKTVAATVHPPSKTTGLVAPAKTKSKTTSKAFAPTASPAAKTIAAPVKKSAKLSVPSSVNSVATLAKATPPKIALTTPASTSYPTKKAIPPTPAPVAKTAPIASVVSNAETSATPVAKTAPTAVTAAMDTKAPTAKQLRRAQKQPRLAAAAQIKAVTQSAPAAPAGTLASQATSAAPLAAQGPSCDVVTAVAIDIGAGDVVVPTSDSAAASDADQVAFAPAEHLRSIVIVEQQATLPLSLAVTTVTATDDPAAAVGRTTLSVASGQSQGTGLSALRQDDASRDQAFALQGAIGLCPLPTNAARRCPATTGRNVVLEPQVVDTVVADVRLLLAGAKQTSAGADSAAQPCSELDDWQSADPAADELALELAWDAISLGVQ